MKTTKASILMMALIYSVTGFCQNIDKIKDILDSAPSGKITPIPYSGTKTYNPASGGFWIGFGEEKTPSPVIPLKTYNNLNLTQSDSVEYATMIHKFIPQNGNYYLIELLVGESEFTTTTLATFKTNGELINFVESEICLGDVMIKQYSINSDMTVTLYSLQVTSLDNVDPFTFTSVTAQRKDTKYQIDSTGHFIQIEEKLYQPKNYTRTELENNNYNIWQGNEVPVQ